MKQCQLTLDWSHVVAQDLVEPWILLLKRKEKFINFNDYLKLLMQMIMACAVVCYNFFGCVSLLTNAKFFPRNRNMISKVITITYG